MKIKIICKNCKKEFETLSFRIKYNRGKFCSRKCMGKWNSVNHTKENNPNWRGGKKKRICMICKNEFLIKPSVIKKGSGMFCSNKCAGIWMSKNCIGKNSSNWKGGITVIKRGIKRSLEYREWRKEVLKRDNFTCRKCFKKNSRIAHHIKPFALFIELRFAIDNGMTLCYDCHKKIHYKRLRCKKKNSRQ
jgi:hypothetical protein